MTQYLLAGIAALAVIWIAWTFNRLIRLRNRTRAGWSDIDVQLQRRHDLIPKLAEAVEGYASYEQATLSSITELRRLSDDASHLADKAAAEDRLAAVGRQLIAVAEDYPDLKANRNFLSLQEELTHTEDLLQYARRFYNGAVREFNTQRESFPDLIVARLFGFQAREFFSAEAGAGDAIRVKLA
jgi:LemA protein